MENHFRILDYISLFFDNHLNLFSFYVIANLCIICPFHLFGYTPFQRFFRLIYAVWTVYLVLNDLIKKRLKFDGITVTMACFFIWACISYLFQPRAHGIVQLTYLFTLLMMMALFFQMTRYYSKSDFQLYLKFIGKVVIYSVIVLNTLSIIYFMISGTFNLPQSITSLFNMNAGIYHHKVLGGEKCFLAMCFCYYLYKKKDISIASGLITILTSFVILYVGRPRTNYVQIAIVLLYFLFLVLKKNLGESKANKLFGAIVTIILILGIVVLGYTLSGHTINGKTLNEISTGRSNMWRDVFVVSLERPVLGWGWGNGEPMGDWVGVGFVENCHNMFLNVLLWTGFPGLLMFCGMVVLCILKIRRNKSLIESSGYTWFIVVTFALFVQAMLDPLVIGEDTRLGSPFFWLFAGMLYYLDQTKECDNTSIS